MSRTLTMFVVAMALTLGMMACEKKTSPEKAPAPTQPAGVTADSAAKSVSAAFGDATKGADGLLAQSKDAAVKAAQTAVDSLEKKWQDLVAKAAPATPEAKTDLQKSKDMTATLADIRTKLTEAKDAGAEAWQKDIKPALDAALKNAQKLYDDTAAKFAAK